MHDIVCRHIMSHAGKQAICGEISLLPKMLRQILLETVCSTFPQIVTKVMIIFTPAADDDILLCFIRVG